jgi:membrane protease YdiL (CAAX protease family)
LHFPPKDGYLSPLDGLAVFAENFVTVALTEEVLFRGILMPWFEHVMPSKHGWFGVVCSSLVFGAMHWPRRTGVEARLIYVLLAVIAGVIYALTAKLSRGLFGSALLHALTDTAWAVVLN